MLGFQMPIRSFAKYCNEVWIGGNRQGGGREQKRRKRKTNVPLPEEKKFNIHGSVHRSNLVVITNKMQLGNGTILFLSLLQAQHVSSGMSLIIRSPNRICSLWFTYACGERP